VRSIVTGYYAEQGWDPTTGAELLGALEALEIAEYAEHRVHAVGHGAGSGAHLLRGRCNLNYLAHQLSTDRAN
jgi:hypothetical protein